MQKYLGLVLASLLLALMAYAGWLTSDWTSVLGCTPAILMMAAVVGGLIFGVVSHGSSAGVAEPGLAAVAAVPIRRARPAAPTPRSTYNEGKIRRILPGIDEVPEKYTRKKARPREVAQVLAASCTGCGLCVPFCPVDCIEIEPASKWPNRLPPARVVYDECVGCGICARVCERLAWDATVMRPTAEIEREQGIVIHDTLPLHLDSNATGF